MSNRRSVKRRRSGAWVTIPCAAACGAVVERRRSDVRKTVYCSRECYWAHGASLAGKRGGSPRHGTGMLVRCPDGTERTVVIAGDGYRTIYWPDHPNANMNWRVYEHVAVMADMLGRPLEPHERVHHRNGDRADNRLGNLDLWSTAQPCGQRVEDKVAFAVEMLDLYAPHLLVKRPSISP